MVAVAVGVAIVVVATAVSAAGSGHHSSHVGARAVPLAHRRPAKHAVATRTPSTTPKTPTSAKPVEPMITTAFGGGQVTVTAPYALTLRATAPCWVQVRSDNGQTLYEGTLQAGESRAIEGTGSLTMRLGNTPALGLLVNGTPLDLSGVARTGDLRFQA